MLNTILTIFSIVANAACTVLAVYGIYVMWKARKLEKEIEALLKEAKEEQHGADH